MSSHVERYLCMELKIKTIAVEMDMVGCVCNQDNQEVETAKVSNVGLAGASHRAPDNPG